jgi:hypothetical protein
MILNQDPSFQLTGALRAKIAGFRIMPLSHLGGQAKTACLMIPSGRELFTSSIHVIGVHQAAQFTHHKKPMAC